jgi:hypothetical protein
MPGKLVVPASAGGIAPPWAYPDPNSASEVVDVEVLSVSKRFRSFASSFTISRYNVEVVARVTKVQRSATRLKPGSKIAIRYDAHNYNCPAWCGPSSFPILDGRAVYVDPQRGGAPDGIR